MASTIFLAMLVSLRKCCPKNFLGRTTLLKLREISRKLYPSMKNATQLKEAGGWQLAAGKLTVDKKQLTIRGSSLGSFVIMSPNSSFVICHS